MQEDLRQSSRLPPPPASLCYQHHASFLDLENAANNGCPLCQFIVDCFKWTAYKDGHIPKWPRGNKPSAELAGSMYAVAKGLEVSDVRICLDNRDITSEWNMSRSVDKMNVRVGPFYELPLVITSPRGKYQSSVDGDGHLLEQRIGRGQATTQSDVSRQIWILDLRRTTTRCDHGWKNANKSTLIAWTENMDLLNCPLES